MAYLALYREWRPRAFREVVGQEHITRTLVNSLKSGRVAHAYLFCGPRGTGKTSTAKVLARALNCLGPDGIEPCGRCGNCLEIQEGTSMDVIEIDAASNRGIDEVRELRENIKFSPASGSKRVYIIDEVHMLTDPAFNALLKTLEEPPVHAVFILATTEPHRVPLTILSRCQRFDFHRISPAGMADRLRQVAAGAGIELEDGALELMVRAADGGLRDALSLLDQARSFGDGRVTAGDVHRILGTVREEVLENLYSLMAAGRAGECLALVGEISEGGADLRLFVRELTAYMRGLMLRALSGEDSPAGPGGPPEMSKILEVLTVLTRLEQEMKWSTQPRVLLEVALVRSCRLYRYGDTGEGRLEISELAARVAELEGMAVRLGVDADTGQFHGINKTRREKGEETGLAPAVPARAKKRPGKGENISTAVKPAKIETSRNIENKPDKNGNDLISPPPGEDGEGRGDGAAVKTGKGGLLLDKVAGRWEDIKNLLGRSYANIYSYLTMGKGGWPVEVSGGFLTVAFWEKDESAGLAVAILNSDSNKKDFEGIIKSVCQEDLKLKFVISKEEPPAVKRREELPAAHDEAAGLFGGEEQPCSDDSIFDD